jgi:hypothetical protein
MTNATVCEDRPDHWLVARRDPETAIESPHAHFTGHAYDPHDHDDMLYLPLSWVERAARRRMSYGVPCTHEPGGEPHRSLRCGSSDSQLTVQSGARMTSSFG